VEFLFTTDHKAWFHANGVLHGVPWVYEVIVELYHSSAIFSKKAKESNKLWLAYIDCGSH